MVFNIKAILFDNIQVHKTVEAQNAADLTEAIRTAMEVFWDEMPEEHGSGYTLEIGIERLPEAQTDPPPASPRLVEALRQHQSSTADSGLLTMHPTNPERP